VSRVTSIKRSQKESLLRREISSLLQQASLDNPELAGLSVTHIELSRDKGVCYVYFYSPDGNVIFEKKRSTLVLFKPSLRKAIAQKVPSRYVPEIIFKYDFQLEKQLAIEQLLDKVKKES
jgi:ribosome-binding factor A